MIDSTEPNVIEAALKIYAGRPVVNSINLENGRTKIDEVMPLVREAGAAVVALTIDETGMAKTAERKLEIARRIHDIVTTEYALAAGRADFRRADVHAGDRRCGISGFGRGDDRGHPPDQARAAGRADVARRLERLVRPQAGGARRDQFGHAAPLRQAGLDMAIVNAKDITPYAELGAVSANSATTSSSTAAPTPSNA